MLFILLLGAMLFQNASSGQVMTKLTMKPEDREKITKAMTKMLRLKEAVRHAQTEAEEAEKQWQQVMANISVQYGIADACRFDPDEREFSCPKAEEKVKK